MLETAGSYAPTFAIGDETGDWSGTWTVGGDLTLTPQADDDTHLNFDVSAALQAAGDPDGILQGDLYDGMVDVPYTAPTVLPPYRQTSEERADVRGGNVLARWTQFLSESSEANLQMYFDRTLRSHSFFREERNTFDVDFHHYFSLFARLDVTWGLEYRVTSDFLGEQYRPTLNPTRRTDNLYSTFLQQLFTLPALAGMKWRGIEVDQQPCPGGSGLLRRTRFPDIFTDGDADGDIPDRYHARFLARLKIAFFIKHAVIRQVLLAINGADRPPGNYRGHIEQGIALPERVSDYGHDAVNLSCYPFDRLFNVFLEMRAQQQVLRRVSADTQLRKYNGVGRQFVAGTAAGIDNPAGIRLDSANRKIQLRHDDA